MKLSVTDPAFWEEKDKAPSSILDGTQQVNGMLTSEIEEQQADMKKRHSLNKFSPIEEIDDFVELSGDYLADTLWNKVFYHSSFSGPAAETTSASELFSGSTRESDTSGKKYLSPERVSKFRCHFYFNTTDSFDSTTYIGSFGTFTSDTGLTSINQTGVEYIALKVDDSNLSLVSKNANGNGSNLIPQTITNDDTHVLEMHFFPRERVDFYLDLEYVGSISEFLPTELDVVTYMPLMLSIQRQSAINRKVTIESWEFIQSRK